MTGESSGPIMAPPLSYLERGGGAGGSGGPGGEERWRHFDNSVNAVSFGFVATAILISMFLVMAIFERFLRPTSDHFSPHGQGRRTLRWRRTRASPPANSSSADLEAHRRNFSRKLDFPPSPKMSIYAKGVSVLMPGNDIPTFIAHPAPAPCPPERIPWPPHHHVPIGGSTMSSS